MERSEIEWVRDLIYYMATSLFLQQLFSNFFKVPDRDNRHYLTFILSIIAVNMLAGIYWWHTQSILLVFVPLITSLFKPLRFFSALIFCSIALYCLIIEYNYKRIQASLYNQHLSGVAHVHDITHNQSKNNYRIICSFAPENKECSALIQLFVSEKPTFEAGSHLKIEKLFFTPIANKSYQLYLLKESIHATSYCTNLSYSLIYQERSIKLSIKEKISDIEDRVSSTVSKQTALFFSSLFLGSKKYIQADSTDIKNYFNTWGINHFLARSGLHVSLVLFFVLFICRSLQLSLLFSHLLTLFFLTIYLLFSYSSVSFMRAIITAFLTLWCLSFRVPINIVHILLLSLLFTVIYNPFFLLFLDFQLTFLLTFGLAILTLLDF